MFYAYHWRITEPIVEHLKKIGHREFLARIEFLKEYEKLPKLEHYYLAQVALEVYLSQQRPGVRREIGLKEFMLGPKEDQLEELIESGRLDEEEENELKDKISWESHAIWGAGIKVRKVQAEKPTEAVTQQPKEPQKPDNRLLPQPKRQGKPRKR